jgi:hypothetical protein
MPAILATEEAEIRKRIMVQSQPGQILHKTLSQNKTSQKKGWWSGSSSKGALLSKCEALSSNPGAAKKKKKV